MGVRCIDCHDAHSLKLRNEGNRVCLQCHSAPAYDDARHHFHKKEWQGKPSAGALCVSCHMPKSPFMVVHMRADHSIRIPRPDLTQAIGVPNACASSGCHADKAASWIGDAYDKWYGKARKPHYGTAFAAGRRGDAAAKPDLLRIAADPLPPTIVRDQFGQGMEPVNRFDSVRQVRALPTNFFGGPEVRRERSVGRRRFRPQLLRHVRHRLKEPEMLVKRGEAAERQFTITVTRQFGQRGGVIDDMPGPAESVAALMPQVKKLRHIGQEFGATTGRPRRCGWLDVPQLLYTIMLNGVTQIIITKMDVLDTFETIDVATAYQYDNIVSEELPFDIVDKKMDAVYQSFEGWNQSLDHVTQYSELPSKAKDYITHLERLLKTRISMISTGPEREKLYANI